MISHNDAVKKALIKASSMGALVHRNEGGLFYDKRGNPRKLGVKGRPDIDGSFSAGSLPGVGVVSHPLAIEIKTGSATRTIEQRKWSERFISLGGIYVLARYDTDRGIDGDLDIEAAINQAREKIDAVAK